MLLDNNKPNYINIEIFYSYIEDEYGKRIIVLEEDKAKKLLNNEDKKEKVNILSTKWVQLNWEQENNIMNSVNKVDPHTGSIQFDVFKFRDSRIKSCLKEWNLKDEEGNKIPVNDNNINRLPSDIVLALLDKYDKAIKIGEEKMGK